MDVELPLFKNGKHNFESASTIDRVITPLIDAVLLASYLFLVLHHLHLGSNKVRSIHQHPVKNSSECC